jgi:hypothetical protein
MIRLKTLLFEVSLDQLKTQFVDTNKITDSEFTEIIDASGGKTAYATWLTKLVAAKTIKPEDLYKYNAYFKVFDRRKREYPFQDINQYKTPQDISQFIDTSVELANREKSDPSQQKGVAKADKYKEFYIGSVDGFDVYELPKGRRDLYGTSCELGSGTEWCTATNKTTKWFNKYIKQGPLFIFIKPGSDEKYQFAYESHQFMDKNDKRINILTPLSYKLFEFIESMRPKYEIPVISKLLHDPDKIPDNVEYDVELQKTPIKSLRNLKSVGGNLDLVYTPIESLGNLKSVGGALSLVGTSIKSLGNLESVGDDIRAWHTPIESLGNLKSVGGALNVWNTSIKSLDNLESVGGNLIVDDTPLESFGNLKSVGGALSLVGTPLADKYSEEQIRKMIDVKRSIRLS